MRRTTWTNAKRWSGTGALLALLAAAPAGAWGRVGHAAVAEVAMRHLSAPARAALDALLGGEDPRAASLWADDVTVDTDGASTDPWHYLNLLPGERTATMTPRPEGDVVAAVRRFRAVLADPAAPAAARGDAARWLIHLVGDVHQPLHVGFAEDRGGNDVAVAWEGEVIDLHGLWDWAVLADWGDDAATLADHLPPATAAEKAAWRESDVAAWAAESQALRHVAYASWAPPPGGGAVAVVPAHVAAMRPLLARRLLMAGVRLAAIFEAALGPVP